MTARAETILATVKTLLTGLTTTGSNVQRGQIYGHQAADLPALAIFMGADQPELEQQTGLIDWELTLRVESTVLIDAEYTADDAGLDTQLNLIREEVHAALMADHTLGLAFVIDVTPGAAGEPNLSGDGAEPIGSQVLEFLIQYRSSRVDIGN